MRYPEMGSMFDLDISSANNVHTGSQPGGKIIAKYKTIVGGSMSF
jgi:hypothetical protein